jgi:hypothetical protein
MEIQHIVQLVLLENIVLELLRFHHLPAEMADGIQIFHLMVVVAELHYN